MRTLRRDHHCGAVADSSKQQIGVSATQPNQDQLRGDDHARQKKPLRITDELISAPAPRQPLAARRGRLEGTTAESTGRPESLRAGPGGGWPGGLLSPGDHCGSRRVLTSSWQIMINLRFSL